MNHISKGDMDKSHYSNIPRGPHLTKEQRLPKSYKEVEKLVKSVRSCQANFKTALAKSKLRGAVFKKVYKLTLNVLKYYNYIKKIIDKLELIKKEKFLREEIAAILIYELIFGNGTLPGESKAVTTVQEYQNDILTVHEKFQNSNTDCAEMNEIYVPRYARVHTLITTLTCAIKDLENCGFRQIFYDADLSEEKHFELVKSLEMGNFLIDFHFKDILVFSQAENLVDLDLYKNGHIFLQDKASYIPVHALDPEPGSTVLDACAAPGMKSAHIAAKMKNKGILIACERDKYRFETLKETLEYGSVKISRTLCSDFKLIDPNDEAYSGVDYILLDPSCSGSGMVNRMDNITDTKNSKTEERLFKLAGFQIILLKHALKFPSVKRVVYSTCSVHEEENEYVVHEALNAFGSTFKMVPVMPECFDRGSENYEFGNMCLRTVPEKHLTNGFFVAMFERIETYEGKKEHFSVKHIKNETTKAFDDIYPEIVDLPSEDWKTETTIQQEMSCEKSKIYETTEKYLVKDLYNHNEQTSAVKLKHKKNKKETGNHSFSSDLCDQSTKDYKCSNQNVANVIWDSFSHKYEEPKVPEFSKKGVVKGRNKQKCNEQKLVQNSKAALSDSLQISNNSMKSISSHFKANDIVVKNEQFFKNDSKFIENCEIYDDSNFKQKKKKRKRKHSSEENSDIYTQEIEDGNKINSFENIPEKIKESSEFIPSSKNLDCLENKPVDCDIKLSNTSFKVKHIKHRRHSKNSDFTSYQHELSSDFSEFQSSLENNSSVISSANGHVSQNQEMAERQSLLDNYSKHKKNKKHKKHSSKSDEVVFHVDRNPSRITDDTDNKFENETVSLNSEKNSSNSPIQHSCHVKKKRKKYKNDESGVSSNYDYINTNAEHGDTVDDLKQNLRLNDMESVVASDQNDDSVERKKKKKKHKKRNLDDVF